MMSLDIDGGSPEAHSRFDYPENDEELKHRCAELAQECVEAFEEKRYNRIPILELSGVIFELKCRGVIAVVDIDGSVAEVVFREY